MKSYFVICGGSKGIGAATTNILLNQGHEVVVLARTIGELKEIEQNKNLRFISVDFTNREQKKLIFGQLAKDLPSVTGIVNNCGGPATSALLNNSMEDFENAFESHLYTAQQLVQSLSPHFKKQTSGRIVNIISVTARVPLENLGVSNTLRGAMLNWSKTLSKELAGMGVNTNNVLPGYTYTERLKEVIAGASQALKITKEEQESKLLNQIPLKRFGKAEEIAEVVAFLLSEKASYINGASIPVDGGWTTCH